MRTANVLLLSESGEFVGGGELSLLELVISLARSRFYPLVLCPGPGALVERFRAEGIPVEVLEFPTWRSLRPIALFRTLARLAALVEARRISLLHVNATGRVALCAGLVGRGRRGPGLWRGRGGGRGGGGMGWGGGWGGASSGAGAPGRGASRVRPAQRLR